MKIAVITSRFNPEITEPLRDNCLETLRQREVKEIVAWEVPGAFEIPYTAKQLAKKGTFDAIITLGAVIRGETSHFDYVCAETARGIQEVSLMFDLPILFGVLTTENVQQAKERLQKGKEVALAALEMIALKEHFF